MLGILLTGLAGFYLGVGIMTTVCYHHEHSSEFEKHPFLVWVYLILSFPVMLIFALFLILQDKVKKSA